MRISRFGGTSFTNLAVRVGVVVVVLFVGALIAQKLMPNQAAIIPENVVLTQQNPEPSTEPIADLTPQPTTEKSSESTAPTSSNIIKVKKPSAPPLEKISVVETPRQEPSIPQPTVAVPTTPPVPTEVLPPERTINSETIVGLVCYFSRTATSLSSNQQFQLDDTSARGSGVIIHKDGYILTNRHVVAIPKIEHGTGTLNDGSSIEISISYGFKYCNVGQMPKGAHLPTPEEITSWNPQTQISVLGYRATIFFVPSSNQLTAEEAYRADYAILKIIGISDDGPSFGVNSVPSYFPYAEVLSTKDMKIGDPVITYGYPGDITLAKNAAFQTLFMTGSVGKFTGVQYGEGYYSGVPLTLSMNMENYAGRSGSPLFWRGYVIGLVWARDVDNRTNSYAVASDAILKDFVR